MLSCNEIKQRNGTEKWSEWRHNMAECFKGDGRNSHCTSPNLGILWITPPAPAVSP